MEAIASQMTGMTIVYSTVCSGAEQRKYQSSAHLPFFAGHSPITREYPAQRGSYAENVSFDDVVVTFHSFVYS